MRFILLAHQRTGTTVFRNLVNQHPKLFMYGEAMFPDYFDWGWYSYLNGKMAEDKRAMLPAVCGRYLLPYLNNLALQKEANGKQIVGVDIKLPQSELIQDFRTQIRASKFGILHLRRRNTLACVLSYMTMMKRKRRKGIAAHGTETPQNDPVMIDLERLEILMERYRNQDHMANWAFRHLHYMEIWYEDFTHPDGWQPTCDMLSAFFGMPFHVEFTPSLKKQNSSNLMDLIRNADAVREAYPDYFDDAAADAMHETGTNAPVLRRSAANQA